MLLPKFEQDPSFPNLKAAVARGDIAASFEAAHTLKGVTGNYSMTALYRAVCLLVEQLRSKTTPADPVLLAQVEQEYDRVLTCISKL